MGWSEITRVSSPTGGAYALTGLTLSSYDLLELVLTGITVTTDGTDLKLTMYVGAAEQTGATDYEWTLQGLSSGGTVNADQDASDPAILITSNDANWDVGNASTAAYGGIIRITNAASTAFHKRVSFNGIARGPTANLVGTPGTGLLKNTGAVDGFKISGTSNLTAGVVILLGHAP